MDHEKAIEITLLRVERKSYGDIAERLGLSVNTVKSYCLRHDLGDNRIMGPVPSRNTRLKAKREPHPLIGYCVECGTVFKQCKNGSKKFCSTLCAQRWRRKNGNGKYKQVCPICGKEYPVFDDRKPRKYCSQECYRTARYYTDNPERTVTVTCKTCGKEMTFTGHHQAKRKFCSHECYYRYLRTEDIKVQ